MTSANAFSEKSVRSQESISKVQQGSKQSTSAAINIPSPPLTPYLGLGDEDIDDLDYDDDDEYFGHEIFSSRYRKQSSQEDETPILRHSTSAPSMMSPLSWQSSGHVPHKGFMFSSNLSMAQPHDERESYTNFQDKMDRDYWKSVSTIRSTYFFDGIGRGGGFLAIPHLASHGNAKTNVICRLLEDWLTKKLVEPTISDSIPVLEDSIESSVLSIERHLKRDAKVWVGISQASIHIRCGHVFMLDTCCDDQTIIHLGADEFYHEYPLFVDVEIKMQGESPQNSRTKPIEVLIAFQNVVDREKGSGEEQPYIHRTYISESTAAVDVNNANENKSQQPLGRNQ
ncbi:hypothetical protein BGX26_008565 [Mortierella sp. AD094]|nr:hypothetical protein BGX26_008565 [Mortierella sp. AD094]